MKTYSGYLKLGLIFKTFDPMRCTALRIEVDPLRPLFPATVAAAHTPVVERTAFGRRILAVLLHIGNFLQLSFIRQNGME